MPAKVILTVTEGKLEGIDFLKKQNYLKPLAELIDLALVDSPQLHFKSAIAFK